VFDAASISITSRSSPLVMLVRNWQVLQGSGWAFFAVEAWQEAGGGGLPTRGAAEEVGVRHAARAMALRSVVSPPLPHDIAEGLRLYFRARTSSPRGASGASCPLYRSAVGRAGWISRAPFSTLPPTAYAAVTQAGSPRHMDKVLKAASSRPEPDSHLPLHGTQPQRHLPRRVGETNASEGNSTPV